VVAFVVPVALTGYSHPTPVLWNIWNTKEQGKKKEASKSKEGL
jgi:hypothetical protein